MGFNSGNRLLLLLLSISLTNSFTVTSGNRRYFIRNFCSESGNYTLDSPFRKNLKIALSNLPSNTSSNYGYYNVSVGQASDKVYAISYCRGDVSPDTCKSCVDDSIQEIFQCCPNQIEALGFYDYCLLRYSNRSIFGLLETLPSFNWTSKIVVNNTYQFKQELESLLNRLVTQAAWQSPKQKFAVGESDLLYALVQCSEDLSSLNCSICLDFATNNILDCCGSNTGAQFHMPSCNVRFEVYKFYDSTPGGQAIPPQSNGEGGTLIRIKVGFGIGGLLFIVILLTVIGYCILKKWPKRTILKDDSTNLVTRQTEYQAISGPSANIENSEADESHQNGIIDAKASRHSEVHEAGNGLEVQQFENRVVIEETTQRFQLFTIRAATNEFDVANVLGRGAYGVVYKAILPGGEEVAVKRLKTQYSCNEDEFKEELSVLAKLEHINLVKCLGFCLEEAEKILVFEFLRNGSLDRFIFDSAHRPQWETLYSFILGIVQGLLFLHRDSGLCIIHRDIKPANILLDENMIPKIADFGMAKLFREDQTHCESSKIKGTLRYLAPEYANCRRCSRRSDVYSFGVVLLEIVSGRRNNSADPGVHLLSCAWTSLMNDRVSDVFHPSMILETNPLAIDQIKRCIHIGLLCVQANEAQRPKMEEIDEWLKDYSIQLPPPSKPPYFVQSDSDAQIAAPMIVVASSTTSSTSGYQSLTSQ